MTCPRCRARNQVYALFCLDCGETLDATAPASEIAAPAVRPRARLGSRGLRLDRWERLLGLALALILLAAGAGDMLGHLGRVDAYRAARGAEIARHWDVAAAAYAEATGYSDAGARLVAARGQISARDRLYTEGKDAAARSDWPAAQAAFVAASRVQPDYADLPARLAEAGAQAGRLAAAGLVFRRTGAADAGLYLLGALDQPEARLPGSDAASRPIALSADPTQVIYDVPVPGGRGLSYAVAAPGAGRITEARRLPASLPAGGRGVFCVGGVWWFSDATGALTYYDFRSGEARPVALNGRRRLLSYQAGQATLLLAEDYVKAGAPASRVLMAGADGRETTTLLDSPGSVRTADLSPDGHWLLYTREEIGALTIYGHSGVNLGYFGEYWQPNRDDARTTSLLLRWLEPIDWPRPVGLGGTPLERERLLEHLVLPDDGAGVSSIHAAFAPGQPASAVSDHVDAAGRTVTIYEAASGVQTTFWPERAPVAGAGPVFSPRGGYLLVDEATEQARRLIAQPLGGNRPGGRLITPVVEPARGYALTQVSPHDDYLITFQVNQNVNGAREKDTVWSLPLRGGAPVQLFSAMYHDTPRSPTIALAPGGSLVALVRPDGTLAGIPLDGGPALTLVKDVSQVWAPRP
jgi:hypothetical protein